MFQIQMGYPVVHQRQRVSFERMGDVFLHLFAEDEQAFYLFWQDIPIRFRYGEDLAHNVNSIITMAWQIHRYVEGCGRVELGNQLLSMTIDTAWVAQVITLRARFHAAFPLYEPYVAKLNACGNLNLSKQGFLSEWHTLIHQISLFLRHAKIRMEKGEAQHEMDRLNELDQRLEGYGHLYKVSS